MRAVKFDKASLTAAAVAVAVVTLAGIFPGVASHVSTGTSTFGDHGAQLVIPMMNPALGKKNLRR